MLWHPPILIVIIAFYGFINSAEALKCYVCSSDKLETCSTLQMIQGKELPSELCPTNVASCFTKIENGITIRGCSPSRYATSLLTSKECNDSNKCDVCKTNKCNGNVFPESRLHCLHCVGASCVNQTDTIDVRYPCVNYVDGEMCYSIFSFDGSAAYRGCKSDPESMIGKNICTQHPKQCVECSKRGCNNDALKWEPKLSCVKCKQNEEQNCNQVSDDLKATDCAPIAERYNNRCYTIAKNGKTDRGCFYEAPLDIQIECTNHVNESCTLCGSSDCNRANISTSNPEDEDYFNILSEPLRPSHEQFCFQCDSRSDPNCSFRLNSEMVGLCPYSPKSSGCYHIKTDSFVRRGCVASLKNEEKWKCIANGDVCRTCSTVGCNNKIDFAECYVGGSKDIQPKNNFGKKAPSKICKKYDDTCFVYVNGYDLIRGCSDEFLAENELDKSFFKGDLKKYRTCSTPLCNDVEVKPPRLLKLSWLSNASDKSPEESKEGEENNAEDEGNTTEDQGNATEVDGNTTEVEGNTTEEEGHTTEDQGNTAGDEGNNAEDEGHTTQDQGNVTEDEGNTTEVDRNTTEVEGNTTEDEGHTTEDQGNATEDDGNTTEDVGNTTEDQGNTADDEGNTTEDEGHTTQDQGNVTEVEGNTTEDEGNTTEDQGTTTEDDANNRIATAESNEEQMASEDRRCYQCDSRVNPNCSFRLGSEMIANCPSAPEDLGCYHMITDSYVERGCVVSLEDEQRDECQGNDDSCKTCSSNECNKRINFSRCYVSDSAKDQPKSNYKKRTPSKVCEDYDDTCFVYSNGKDVIRGCSNKYIRKENLEPDFFEKLPDSMYRQCSAPLCNDDDVKPMLCYDCDSISTLKCISNLTDKMLKKCVLEVKPSGCYHYKDPTTNISQRGCLADLKDDHRTNLCASDTDQCKKCLGNGCNSKPNFQWCLTCDNDHSVCHSEMCKRYTDECFIHVADNNVRRGCLSHTVDSPINGVDVVSDCKNTDLCETCSDRNDCNIKQIPEEHCLVCDSKTSYSNCTFYPSLDLRKKCPLAVKEMGCYLSKDLNLVVTRGCRSELSVDDRYACKGSNMTCKPCMGDSCNIKRSFQSCFDCSSKVHGPDCEHTPWILRQKMCEDYLGACYTQAKDGIVTRGCVGDIHVPDLANCSDSRTCKTCSDNKNCNDNSILPEVCISCDSEKDDWCKGNLGKAINETCPLRAMPQGCYHFINQTTGHVRRGCISNLGSENEMKECQKNSSECKSCLGTNCNLRNSFETCVHCNSVEDPNCANDPVNAYNKMCKNYDDQCYTFIGKVGIQRGCLHELSHEFQKKCKANKDKCEACTSYAGSACNNRVYELEKCVECDSATKEECRDRPELFVDRICNSIKATSREGCYLKIENDRYVRGCMQNLTATDRILCSKESDECKSCSEKNCNVKHTFQECYSCDGRDEHQCARNSTLGESIICKDFLSNCFIGIDAKGRTHRGCSKDIENDRIKFKNKLEICVDNNCNGRIYPEDRLKCYQCDGEDYCEDMEAQPCNVLSEYDQCYSYLSADGKMYKGCLTDSTSSRLLCDQNDETCVKCSTSGCNNQPNFKEPSFSCVKCNDTTDCAYGQDVGKATKCETKFPFSSQESCYMRTVADTDVVERGCTLDVSYGNWCTEENDCETCNSTGCNVKNKEFHWCIECSSEINGECSIITNPNEFIEPCDGQPYPYSKKGCYTMYKENRISRGCLKDLEQQEYEDCQTEDWCEVCKDDYCNKEGIFPKDRLQCYRCNGEDECNLMPSNTTDESNVQVKIEPCSVVSEHDQCYSYLGTDGKTYRGCLSDATESRLSCEKDETACIKCSTSGCNNQPKFQEPTFSCAKCNDSTDCAFGQVAEKATKCEGKVPFSSKESCYTRIVNETDVIERGCTFDVSESNWCTEENGCETCNSTGCNVANKKYHSCVQCSSKINGNCSVITDSDEFFAKCDGHPYPYTKRGCYVIYKENHISRGCVKDLEQKEYEECKIQKEYEDKWCNICEENNCNKESISSGEMLISNVLMSFVSIFVILQFN